MGAGPGRELAVSMAMMPGCRSTAPVETPTADLAHARDTELARLRNGQAYDLIKQKKYPDAEAMLHKALQADPSFGPRSTTSALSISSSIACTTLQGNSGAAGLMPQQPEPINNLGMVLERAGKLAEAIAAYEKAHAMSPEHAEYLGNLASARVRDGENDDTTRSLLDQVLLRDTRPDWQSWARSTLQRLRRPTTEMGSVESR